MSAPRAIILAAGRGSRMGGLTEAAPKGLVSLGGKPLVQWQLDALHGAGVSEVAIVRGYRGELFDSFDAHAFKNPRWSETNMVRTLTCAAQWLREGPVLVSYADIVYPASTAAALADASGEIVVASNTRWRELWEARFDNPLSDAETFRTDGEGRLLEIGGRAATLDEIEGQYMGLLRFTPGAWEGVERALEVLGADRADRLDMTGLISRMIADGAEVRTVWVDGQWYEIDTESDLALARRRVETETLFRTG